MPRQTMATTFGAMGKGDLLVVEDWGNTPEIWVVERLDPAGPYGYRMHSTVITPERFASGQIVTRDVLQATLEHEALVTVKQLKQGGWEQWNRESV